MTSSKTGIVYHQRHEQRRRADRRSGGAWRDQLRSRRGSIWPLHAVSRISSTTTRNASRFSEDTLNTWDTNVPRKMRTYPMKNPDGSVVPNAYVIAFEDYNLAV